MIIRHQAFVLVIILSQNIVLNTLIIAIKNKGLLNAKSYIFGDPSQRTM